MQTARLLSFLGLLAHAVAADEPAARLQMANSTVRDVLAYYQRAAQSTVYVSTWVDRSRLVTIESATPVTNHQGLQLIRTTLLKDHDILIRDTKTGETLVESVTPREAPAGREKKPVDPDAKEDMQFRNTDVADVLVYYEARSGQPVFSALNLRVDPVTFSNKKPLSPGEVLPFIRDTLGETRGIEFRTLFDGEVLVKGPPPRRPAAGPLVPRAQPRVRSISK